MNDERGTNELRVGSFVAEAVRPYGDLRKRTKFFAKTIVLFYETLPNRVAAQVLSKQALRSGTSIGAHYREAQRARSTAEFISKVETLLQELDETIYWIELLHECGFVSPEETSQILNEADQLMAIFVASVKTAKARKR